MLLLVLLTTRGPCLICSDFSEYADTTVLTLSHSYERATIIIIANLNPLPNPFIESEEIVTCVGIAAGNETDDQW